MRRLLQMGRRNERGFTLIELLVVVAIIGILVTIAAPRLISATDGAKARKAEADIRIIENALERFHTDWGVYPLKLGTLVDQKYLKQDGTLKNSFGQYYFYAVKYSDANPASEDPRNFKGYVLADPGQYPPTVAAEGTGATPPAGNNPTSGTWFWGSSDEVDVGGITQSIDFNNDGDTVDTGETISVADEDSVRYGNTSTRPAWSSYSGKVVTEQ